MSHVSGFKIEHSAEGESLGLVSNPEDPRSRSEEGIR